MAGERNSAWTPSLWHTRIMTALQHAHERQIYGGIKQTLLMTAAASHRSVPESNRSISTIAAPQSVQTQMVVASASVPAQAGALP